MTIEYHYDNITNEFTTSNEADKDRFSNEPLLSAFSTFIPVCDFGTNERPIFVDNKWVITPDFRGIVWDTTTKQPQIYNTLGALPKELTNIQPSNKLLKWSGTSWVFDLEASKTAKRNEIQAAVQSSISNGVAVNVLGSDYFYPTSITDQISINNLVVKTLLPNDTNTYKIWSRNSKGVWARYTHTSAQLQQIQIKMVEYIESNKNKYEELLSQIDKANSEESINSIIW